MVTAITAARHARPRGRVTNDAGRGAAVKLPGGPDEVERAEQSIDRGPQRELEARTGHLGQTVVI